MRELDRLVAALRRRWWVIVVAVIVGAIGGAVSAAASGGPDWVASASVHLAADASVPAHGARNPVDLVPVQTAIDETTSSSAHVDVVRLNGPHDVSVELVRHGADDQRRVVRITVSTSDRKRTGAVLRDYVQRFHDELRRVQERWSADAVAALDRARGADVGDPLLPAVRTLVDRLGVDDLVVSVDVGDPSAPTATAVVALLSALALGALAAATVALGASGRGGSGPSGGPPR